MFIIEEGQLKRKKENNNNQKEVKRQNVYNITFE